MVTKELPAYEPTEHGAVDAIRIFSDNNGTPMAELAFAFGGTQIIEWTNYGNRQHYAKGINGYTYIFDERDRPEFSRFIRPLK